MHQIRKEAQGYRIIRLQTYKFQTIMAKQNNSLTELQALEGIYEHLSTIDDLAKEVGMISTRLRKIEEQLKEPVNITDPILAQDLTRDTCIYGALAKSMEACREV